MWLKNKIQKLQNQPYQRRVRILWASLAIAIIIILAIWALTLRYREISAKHQSSQPWKFKEILENAKRFQKSK